MSDVDPAVQNVINLAERQLKLNLVARHPELRLAAREDDIRNEQAIDRIFFKNVMENGQPCTDESYEAAYCQALQNGELVLPQYSVEELQAFDARDVNTGKHLMSTAQMREYLRATREPPPPQNMADFLDGTGSYRWKMAQPSATDEEALAALRGKLTGAK